MIEPSATGLRHRTDILTDQEWEEIEKLALTRLVRADLARLAILRKRFREANTDTERYFDFIEQYQEFVKDVKVPKRPFIEKNMKL